MGKKKKNSAKKGKGPGAKLKEQHKQKRKAEMGRRFTVAKVGRRVIRLRRLPARSDDAPAPHARRGTAASSDVDMSPASPVVGPGSAASSALVLASGRPRRNAGRQTAPAYLGDPEWGGTVGARGFPSGHSLDVVIGPGVTLTSSSADQRTNMAAVRELNAHHSDVADDHGGQFIAGHILNANFQGSGTMGPNVMPLTHNANHAQETAADSKVKGLLTIAQGTQAQGERDRWYGVDMRVRADDFGSRDDQDASVFGSVPDHVDVQWQAVSFPRSATDTSQATPVDPTSAFARSAARQGIPLSGGVRIHNFGDGDGRNAYWSPGPTLAEDQAAHQAYVRNYRPTDDSKVPADFDAWQRAGRPKR